MDTEFPGVVYPCPSFSTNFYYKFTKANVDKLKMIQLGISLFNKKVKTFSAEFISDVSIPRNKQILNQTVFELYSSNGILPFNASSSFSKSIFRLTNFGIVAKASAISLY